MAAYDSYWKWDGLGRRRGMFAQGVNPETGKPLTREEIEKRSATKKKVPKKKVKPNGRHGGSILGL